MPTMTYRASRASSWRYGTPGSHVDGALVDGHGGFLDRLGAGRMRVAGAREVLGRAAEFHQHRRFVDHLARFRPDDVHPEHPGGRRVGEDLHEAVGGVVDLGAAVRREGELADVVGDPRGLQLLLGPAYRGDFRVRVDDARDDLVVHVAGLAGEDLGDRDALVLRLVGEHGSGDDVADGVDARDVGGEMGVGLDGAAAVELDAERVEAEPLRVGHTADGDEDHVRLDGLRRAARRGLHGHHGPGLAALHLGDLRRELEGETLPGEHALELLADLEVHPGQDAVEVLDHGHLRAEAPPYRAELEADDAGADDDEALRHGGQLESTRRRHHDLFVDLDAGEACDV